MSSLTALGTTKLSLLTASSFVVSPLVKSKDTFFEIVMPSNTPKLFAQLISAVYSGAGFIFGKNVHLN